MKRKLSPYLAAAALAAGALVPQVRPARADAIDKLGKRLVKYEAEVQRLKSGIQRPDQIGKARTKDLVTRRIIDAQVNFGVGNYDDSAVVLYDIVAKHEDHPSWDEALYYLSESLFQKGDYVGSRKHFERLVTEVGSRTKYYQQALQRLIELTLKLDDAGGVQKWLEALDRVPDSQLRDSVPYVRGKYAFFQEDYDEAIEWFEKVDRDSEYYFQSQYFIGTSNISKGSLGAAARAFQGVVREQPEKDEDRRVVELSHMALGRLFYERDQPSRAVDQYLRISRRSDLFDEALYEVSWVYVKNKEFKKALRALELLSLADPTSAKLPDVKILEGNLRIRKAQRIVEEGGGNAQEEYNRAVKVFENLRKTFKEPRRELLRLMEEHEDPRIFMAQITGRQSETFETHATLPPVAAAWLRKQPEVDRVVGIEDDLGQIRREISTAEETIARLEQALASPSRVNIFPALAEKRTRSTEILEELFKIRIALATHERARISQHASPQEKARLERLQKKRQSIARKLEELPNSDVAYGERIEKARNQYTKLDQRAAEVATIIDTTKAQVVALEKYLQDQGAKELDSEEIEKIEEEIAELNDELEAMQEELDQIRKDATLAKDRAGTGDQVAERARLLRQQLRQALDDEHRYLERIIAKLSGKQRTKAKQIANLTQKANSITLELDELNQSIDAIVEDALTDVRSSLSEEKARLAAYKKEFNNYEVESRELGGEVLGLSFDDVADKFYDVLIRSDVGVVDVAWSLREAADARAKRLTLDQARERKTLDAEFSDVIKDIREQKAEELRERAEERGAQ